MIDDLPVRDQLYTDFRGRILRVLDVVLGDPAGREVRGSLKSNGVDHDYSCTLDAWVRVWKNKEPPADPRKMTHG